MLQLLLHLLLVNLGKKELLRFKFFSEGLDQLFLLLEFVVLLIKESLCFIDVDLHCLVLSLELFCLLLGDLEVLHAFFKGLCLLQQKSFELLNLQDAFVVCLVW